MMTRHDHLVTQTCVEYRLQQSGLLSPEAGVDMLKRPLIWSLNLMPLVGWLRLIGNCQL